MSKFNDLLDRSDCAKRVGHVGDCNKLRTLGQTLFEFLDMEHAFVIDRCKDKLCALPLTDEVPWNDIGVMFHNRQKDFIALADIGHTVTVSDRIDRFSRILGEDDFVNGTGIQKATNRFARLFVESVAALERKCRPRCTLAYSFA